MYDAALRPVRLKITQFSELRNVQRLQPVSISALAKEMALDRSTLGRNLLVLAAVLRKAIPCWEAAQRKLNAKLGAEDTQALLRLLSRIEGLR